MINIQDVEHFELITLRKFLFKRYGVVKIIY